MERLSNDVSNWEFVVFYLLDSCITERQLDFTLPDVTALNNNYLDIYYILKLLGHKKKPTSPEATIRKTLQKMRDRGWVKFVIPGEYELSKNGYNKLSSLKKNIEAMQIASQSLQSTQPSKILTHG